MEDYLWEEEVEAWGVWAPLVLQPRLLHLMLNQYYYQDYYNQMLFVWHRKCSWIHLPGSLFNTCSYFIQFVVLLERAADRL